MNPDPRSKLLNFDEFTLYFIFEDFLIKSKKKLKHSQNTADVAKFFFTSNKQNHERIIWNKQMYSCTPTNLLFLKRMDANSEEHYQNVLW